MPSVCKNSEKGNVLEAEQSLTPYKACISALDKKLRNLEKRKGKLDGYRDKLTRGEKLDKDQKEAVDKYESVIANLEFARELQKLYQSMSDEADKLAEKNSKKQAKKEKLERQQQELDRLSDVLKLQSLMLSVGTEEIRVDLLAGKYGGLTEQNLVQLDEFYQLISPAVDSDTSFTSQLSSATEHLLSYVERAEKQAVDATTYRELHELVDRLSSAGFFDGAKGQDSNTAAGSAEQTKTESGDESNTLTKVEETVDIGLRGDESSSVVSGEVVPSEESQESYEAMSLPEATSLTSSSHLLQQSITEDSSSMTWYPSTAVTNANTIPQVDPMAAVTKSGSLPPVSAMTDNARYQRPLQEIVSSLQGSYNFLQESEIDVEQSFERVNFMAQPDHSYTFVNQQMSLQHSGTDLGQFGAGAAVGVGSQQNGGFVPPHHHQVAMQEPGFVVVGHDPTSGEVQYAYAGSQSNFLNPVDVSGQQAAGLGQSKCVTQSFADTSVKRVGGGDAQDTMLQGVTVLPGERLPTGHQGFDPSASHGAVYGGGRGGGRGGGVVYSARGGASRAGNLSGAGGHGMTAGTRGGKSR